MTVDDKLFYDIDAIHYSSQYFYKPFEWQNVEISEIFGVWTAIWNVLMFTQPFLGSFAPPEENISMENIFQSFWLTYKNRNIPLRQNSDKYEFSINKTKVRSIDMVFSFRIFLEIVLYFLNYY